MTLSHVAKRSWLEYGGRPVYFYDLFQKRSVFPGRAWPFALDRLYAQRNCPLAEVAFDCSSTTSRTAGQPPAFTRKPEA